MDKKKVLLVVMVALAIVSIFAFSRQVAPTSKADEAGKGQTTQEQNADGTKENEEAKDEQEAVQPEAPAKDEGVVYISASKLNVREEAKKDAGIVDSLMKGSAVKIIEEKTDENNENWYKIGFDGMKGEASGWIAASFTVEDRTELLSEELKKLDYSPQVKTFEYPNNPRVKVKGIYLTLYSASNNRLDELIELSKRTQINTFVIDVKDDNGHMLFKTKAAEKYSPDANAKAPVKDIEALMKKLKENNIYTIARIVSFKDPTYTKQHKDRAIVYRATGEPFTNSDGLIWASAHDRDLWNYNIEVSKEAAEAGFNEIQFDYVRFPASNGGKLDKQLDYRNTKGESKPETIQNYLKFAREQLAPLNVYISADIYGLVGSVADDMALGQYWEAVSNVVDYVSPMMYPSHYANGTYGLSIPDAFPYETIYHSTKDSVNRNKNIQTPATIRPWIQAFTAPWVKGHIKYNAKEVADQIRALEENGVDEYLLWNAGNKYPEEAVKK
ncbi:MAG: hypothetical protein K0R93_2397 [Anaerosolibacter sp.]|jgi:hypothetical protein|uniref:putative glycoside hydrolase n=1 Tax=Anaerosolibacter sp. TaxID=1872527 RepID=UPI002620CF18|nr:putative glycoside hydrolase [Anaerosolibacter sp.]MDF2547499.1 hypothetical protein [Anaerosolibacter sp.]